MEPHESDPKGGDETTDSWASFSDEFRSLGGRLKETYREVADEHGPSEDEIKDAFGTLMGAWDQVSESVATALSDPEVRQRVKDAVGSFASAIGSTVSDLGAELRKEASEEE